MRLWTAAAVGLGLVIFACQCGSYGLTLWIPQIIQNLSGLSDLAVSMISALPYVAASIGMILIGGLNPVAAVVEEGLEVDNKAMSTVMEFEHLRDIQSVEH